VFSRRSAEFAGGADEPLVPLPLPLPPPLNLRDAAGSRALWP